MRNPNTVKPGRGDSPGTDWVYNLLGQGDSLGTDWVYDLLGRGDSLGTDWVYDLLGRGDSLKTDWDYDLVSQMSYEESKYSKTCLQGTLYERTVIRGHVIRPVYYIIRLRNVQCRDYLDVDVCAVMCHNYDIGQCSEIAYHDQTVNGGHY